jgi:hypothetical protein
VIGGVLGTPPTYVAVEVAVGSWASFEREAALIAKLGRRLLDEYGKAYLATVTREGAPRVHPICPVIKSGRLLMGLTMSTPKCADLLRDGRMVLHALPGPGDAEFWVEGVAVAVAEDDIRALKGEHPSLRVSAGTRLFEVDIRRACGTTYRAGADGLPVPDRRIWRYSAGVPL